MSNRPFAKQNRSPIACVACRRSKVRCVATQETCQRCQKHRLECTFEVKQSQQLGKILEKITNRVSQTVVATTTQSLLPGTIPTASKVGLIFPKKQHILELVDIFFTNQHQGIFPFLHKPSFLQFLHSHEFNPATYVEDYSTKLFTPNYTANLKYPDPILLMSILALCARLHSEIAKEYGGFLEDDPESFVPGTKAFDGLTTKCASNASKYFGWYARQYIKDVFDSPTVQRIQAFNLLSSHEWGEGNNSRSFLYVGIAARMALVLGLGNESTIGLEDDEGEMKPVVIESKRRTIWSVYLMDRCNSSGRERSPAIRIEDIKVQLPCHESDFLFGNPEPTIQYDNFKSILLHAQNHDEDYTNQMKRIPMVGFTIILFEIWAKIAKWVGEVGVKYEKKSPWLKGSSFYQLSYELDSLEALIPQKYRFNDFNLKLHLELKTATHFGYFHGLFFLCRIFLNREYLFCNPQSFPKGWWVNTTILLLKSLEGMSLLVKELQAGEMMVIAPFTGFEVYTGAITALYFYSFPNEILKENFPLEQFGYSNDLSGIEKWKEKYKELALENVKALEPWKHAWELGRKWHELSLNLRIVFGKLAESSSEINSDDLRHTMQDYGNGKVKEVYMPQKVSPRREIPKTPSNVDMIYLLGQIEFFSPQFPFVTNLPSIYPGWNGGEVNF